MNKLLAVLLASTAMNFSVAADSPKLTVAEWFVGCKTDKFTDERSCSAGTPVLKVESANVTLKSTGATISFGISDHPSYPARVRINGNPAESGGTLFTDPQQVERLLSQMEKGGTALVRLQRWPNRTMEYELDLTQFADGLTRAKRSLAEGCVDQHAIVLHPILSSLSEETRRKLQAEREERAAAFAAAQCKVLTPRGET